MGLFRPFGAGDKAVLIKFPHFRLTYRTNGKKVLGLLVATL
jgi:hypothetical protein